MMSLICFYPPFFIFRHGLSCGQIVVQELLRQELPEEAGGGRRRPGELLCQVLH